HLLGVLIPSYELGMDLSPGDFEGSWATRKTWIAYSYRMEPKKDMTIIRGHTSHPKGWFERFFFVLIDGESVEENCLHLFRREWNLNHMNRILLPSPLDLYAKRDILRNGPFFWNSSIFERIRDAVELQRSRAVSQPLDIPRFSLPGWNRFHSGDGSGTSEFPLPSDFFANLPPGFTTQTSLEEESRRGVVAEGSRLINEGMRVFNRIRRKLRSRISHFKAEEARELFRLRKEVEEQNRRQAELHSRAHIRAERRGRRTILAELERKATLFSTEFQSFKDAQEF
ncbi:hypothetical protein Bca52824_095485, partial [Brassica carinata]